MPCARAWLATLLLLLASGVPSTGADRYHRYPGAIHMHTTYSDGGGSFEELAQAAQAAGLTYIIATDHNTLQPLKDGHERYWGKTLVLIGVEISTDAGHLLALDVPASFTWGTRHPQAVIDRVTAAGGFTILAHPMSPRWPWTDWMVRGYTGIEIVNLSSLIDDDLRPNGQRRLTREALLRIGRFAELYHRNPERAMSVATNATVDRERVKWDELLREGRPVVGIAAVDAHQRIQIGRRVVKAPTYQQAFASVQTYAVTQTPLQGDAAEDRKRIYDAYRYGRLYMVYPRIAAAPKFCFTAQEGCREVTMGETLPFEREARLLVEAPGHSHPVIRLLRDGDEVASVEGERLEWTATSPGVYRVEVYVADRQEQPLGLGNAPAAATVGSLLKTRRAELRPWIFSNPIYLRPKTVADREAPHVRKKALVPNDERKGARPPSLPRATA